MALYVGVNSTGMVHGIVGQEKRWTKQNVSVQGHREVKQQADSLHVCILGRLKQGPAMVTVLMPQLGVSRWIPCPLQLCNGLNLFSVMGRPGRESWKIHAGSATASRSLPRPLGFAFLWHRSIVSMELSTFLSYIYTPAACLSPHLSL